MHANVKRYLIVSGLAAVLGGCYIVVRLGQSWGGLVAAWGVALWVGTLWTGVQGMWLGDVATHAGLHDSHPARPRELPIPVLLPNGETDWPERDGDGQFRVMEG